MNRNIDTTCRAVRWIPRLDGAWGIMIVLLVFAAAGIRVFAQDAGIVGPAEIVETAVRHSHQVRISELEVKALEKKLDQAGAQDLPQLKIEGRAGQYGGLTNAMLGPSITLPAIEDRYGASAELSQVLYAGGRISNSKKAAELERSAAESSRAARENDVRLQALSAYWNWSKAHYALVAIRVSVNRINAHNTDIGNMKQAGVAIESDALSAQVLLEQTKLRFENAKRSVELAKARLAHLTGKPLPRDALPEKPAPLIVKSQASEAEAIAFAFAHRTEKTSAADEAKAMERHAKAVSGAYFPQISLVARYDYARPNSMFFPPAEEWNGNTFVGAVVSWNIFEGGLTRAKVGEMEARASQAELRAEQVNEAIALEVREAMIQLDSALARITVAKQAEKSAERNLEVAANLWRAGTKRHSEMLDALSSYADAELETIVAEADAILAGVALDHALGNPINAKPQTDKQEK